MRLSCYLGGEIPTRGRLGAPLTLRRASGSVMAVIEIRALTKRYGRTTAVSDLTFTVRPGVVTGFLGPNGAGKSTTMRMILGLDEPTSGSVTVNGRPPRAHTAPLREVGGMLDPRAVHPSRSAYHHLLALARTSGTAGPGSMRSSTRSACARWRAGGRAASPSAWGSGWASRRPCSAIPPPWSSTSR